MPSIEIGGLDELLMRVESMGKAGSRVANKALRKAAEPLVGAMSDHINLSDMNDVHLRDDIQISRVKQDSFGRRSVDVGPSKRTAWRAKFLEFGTSKMSARPFMEPAARETQDTVKLIMAATLREGMR